MSSNWTEWSNFVLISIEKIQQALKSLEDNISTIKGQIILLNQQKIELEKGNHKNSELIRNINNSIKCMEDSLKALDTNVVIQKTKLGFIIAVASIISSGLTVAIIQIIFGKI